MVGKKKDTLFFQRGEKKDKLFLGIHVPEWLYDQLIEYAKKYDVSYSHMCRDALKILAGGGRPPSEEPRYADPIPRRKKSAS